MRASRGMGAMLSSKMPMGKRARPKFAGGGRVKGTALAKGITNPSTLRSLPMKGFSK